MEHTPFQERLLFFVRPFLSVVKVHMEPKWGRVNHLTRTDMLRVWLHC